MALALTRRFVWHIYARSSRRRDTFDTEYYRSDAVSNDAQTIFIFGWLRFIGTWNVCKLLNADAKPDAWTKYGAFVTVASLACTLKLNLWWQHRFSLAHFFVRPHICFAPFFASIFRLRRILDDINDEINVCFSYMQTEKNCVQLADAVLLNRMAAIKSKAVSMFHAHVSGARLYVRYVPG